MFFFWYVLLAAFFVLQLFWQSFVHLALKVGLVIVFLGVVLGITAVLYSCIWGLAVFVSMDAKT